MEPSSEAISARLARINSQILGKPPSKCSKMSVITREGLLDALQVLYDECNTDCLKQYDKNIHTFVEKYKNIIQDLKRLRVNILDFEIKDVIGRGHFGEVHVVKEKQTGDTYALKTIKKCDNSDQKRTSFEEERNIMAVSQSVWLTSLQYAFQDDTYLFYVMEYHPGGDLLGLLYRQGGSLPESAASFYIAELVLALNDLHQMGYVHRDIKPDNILLDRCGHLKLADFGSAAKLNDNGLVTDGMPVGTPDYIAPEVLQAMDNKNQKTANYGISCDYWSLGVLAYELVTGNTPFAGKSATSIYTKIMSHTSNLKFPPDVVLSQAYVSLVKSLVTDPKSRITHKQILKHPMFKNVDFSGLREQVPPYVPKVASVDDTSNFSDVQSKRNEPNIQNYKKKTQFSGRNLPFVGFTYTPDATDFSLGYERAVRVKDELVQSLKDKVNSLNRKLIKSESDATEKDSLEKKLEEKCRKLESVEHLREKLERDLAKNISECMVLKRTLEMERKDRIEVEHKALDMIKTAKQKWESSERSKVENLALELEQQKEKICQLTATNGLLNEQLQHALQLKNKHTMGTDNIIKMNRRSVIGLENRLEKMTMETENQLSELRVKLTEETSVKNCLQEQLTAYKKNESSLITKLQDAEYQHTKIKLELETSRKTVKEMEIKMAQLESENRRIDGYKTEIQRLRKEVEVLKKSDTTHKLEELLSQEKNQVEMLERKVQDLQTKLTQANEQRETTKINDLKHLHEKQLSEQREVQEKQLKLLQEQLGKVLEERNVLEVQIEEAHRKEQNNRAKVQSLEDLLARLESGVSKLENGSERESVLQEQVERLENQLVEVHESAAVQKQELGQLKTRFWRMEKDLENSEIDKRILQRELKECEQKNKQLATEIENLERKMEENRKASESALLELSSLNENLAGEVFKLKELLKSYEEKLDDERTKRDDERSAIAEFKHKLDAKEDTIVSLMKQIERANDEKLRLEDKLEETKAKMGEVHQTVEGVTREKVALNNELESSRRELQNTQLNLTALREACTLLENQLIEYEKIHESLEAKQTSLQSNTSKLIADLSKAKEDIQEARKQFNEEKSLRLLAETSCRRLKEDVECLEKECAAYKQQCIEFKQYSGGLAEELNLAEEKIGELEVRVNSYERQIVEVLSENRILKEESSSQLTQLNGMKETNFKLNQLVAEYKDNNCQLLQRVHELETTLNEKLNYYKDREIKSEATIQQQTKLIDYLQSKIEEHNSKKPSFAERLFSHSKKENQPPISMQFNYKDLEQQLSKERQANKALREEILKLKLEGNGKVETPCKKYAPKEADVKMAMERLVKSPAQQKSVSSKQNSLSRMQEGVPHRFESKIATKTLKCVQCGCSISLGRNASICVECGFTAHSTCGKSAPRTCRLPSDYPQRICNTGGRSERKEEGVVRNEEDEMEVVVEGWIKVPDRQKKSWEKRYARLSTTALYVYETQPDGNRTVPPMEIFDLKPADGRGKVVLEPLASEIDVPVASSDLPFVMSVETSLNTTCWPPKNFTFMVVRVQDKEEWYKALQTILQNGKNGETIAELKADIYVNCAVALAEEDAYVFGTDQGLYAHHNKTQTRVAGPSQVFSISIMKRYKKVLMIVDEERVLITCDLGHLSNVAMCAPCTKPTLSFRTINVRHLAGFHILQACNDYVCVATSKQLVIMGYAVDNSEFTPLRVLDTAEPTSCILFTRRSVIVGANKFYEIDLCTFRAEEFLDCSDVRLKQATVCYKMGSFPVAIMQISEHPIEYLVCFSESAFFVDEFGRCSRTTDLKWNHVPRALCYVKPYVYVVEFNAIEALKITKDTCNLRKDSMESLINVDSFRVEFDVPRYLGHDLRGVLVAVKGEVRRFDARKLDDELSVSSQSLETVEDGESDKFSFTSSVEQCLNGTASDAGSDVSEGGYRQRVVKFNTDF